MTHIYLLGEDIALRDEWHDTARIRNQHR